MTIRRASIVLTADASQAIREINRLGGEMERVGVRAETAGDRQDKALAKVGRGARNAALVGAGGLAIIEKANVSFDKSMSGVSASTMETERNLGRLRRAAIKAGADTSFSAKEAADGVTQLAKAGVSTADILDGGLRGALDLAAAGQLSVADAAEYTATALTQFQLEGDKATHVADLLAAGAGKAQGEVSDMALALNYAGVPADQLGVSIEQTAGTIALLAKNGIVGEKAGTSLRGMLASLSSPSATAKRTMDQLGISVFDAQGKFVGFDGVAGQLRKQLAGLTDAERANALGKIFGTEQLQAANILYREGAKGVRQWTTNVNDQGFAGEQAAKMMDNLAGDIEKVKGSLESAFINGGGGFQDGLRDVVQLAGRGIDAFNELPDSVQSGTVKVLALATATTASVYGATKLVGVYQSAATALSGLTRAQAAASTTSTVATAPRKAGVGRGGGLAAGAATVVGLGLITDASDRTSGALSALEGAAGGALAGGALGAFAGPPGAAIGAAIGGLAGAVSALAMRNDDAKASAGAGKAAWEAYGASLDAVTGKITEAGRAQVYQNLQRTGALKTATGLGFSERQVVDAVTSEGRARTVLTSNLKSQISTAQLGIQIQERQMQVGTASHRVAAEQLRDEYAARLRNLKGLQSELGMADKAVNNAQRQKAATQELSKAIDSLPPAAETDVRTNGLPQTRAAIVDLAAKYRLTPKQVATVIRESGGRPTRQMVDGIIQAARVLDRQRAEPTIQARDLASGIIRNVQGLLRGIDGDTATTYIRTVRQAGAPVNAASAIADGGTVMGQRYPYGDKVYAYLAPGEEVITNRNGEADRFRADRAAGRIPAYADGGTVGVQRLADGGPVKATLSSGLTVIFPAPAVTKAALIAAQGVAVSAAQTARSTRETKDAELEILRSRQRVREIERSLSATKVVGKGKSKRRVKELTGFDREVAQAERAAAQRELADLRGLQSEIDKLTEARKASAETFSSNLDIFGRGASAGGALSSVNRYITEATTFGGVVARLKAAGASPELLRQVVAKGQSGDFRSATRLGEALLNQPLLLGQLNSALGVAGQVSGGFGQLTTDPRFLQAGLVRGYDPTSTVVQRNVEVSVAPDIASYAVLRAQITHDVVAALGS